MIVPASGYRPRAAGGHYNTFLALEAADAKFAQLSAYFDGCRIKRNAFEYDFAGGVTDTDADGLLQTVRQFAADAEAWISAMCFVVLRSAKLQRTPLGKLLNLRLTSSQRIGS